MATTRAFKAGNSQAIRIPAEMAYEDMGQDLTITRDGDVMMIRPLQISMVETVAKLRAMPKPSSIEIYEPTEFPDREQL